jgi:hypothetical protein
MNTDPLPSRQRILHLVRAQLATAASPRRCSTCGGKVRADEKYLRLRGGVHHERCARYGGRAPSL